MQLFHKHWRRVLKNEVIGFHFTRSLQVFNPIAWLTGSVFCGKRMKHCSQTFLLSHEGSEMENFYFSPTMMWVSRFSLMKWFLSKILNDTTYTFDVHNKNFYQIRFYTTFCKQKWHLENGAVWKKWTNGKRKWNMNWLKKIPK